MKKILPVLLSCLLPCFEGMTQAAGDASRKETGNKSHILTAGLSLPVGYFAETHFPGVRLEYAWSKKRFLPTELQPKSRLGFIAAAGGEYYFGKEETVSGYPYQYMGFVMLHAGGGILFQTGLKTAVKITAGPALGIYAGATRFNLGAELSASYYMSKRIALVPEIVFRKENKAEPFWSAALKAGYLF
jgi:hypothetical protein